MKLVAQSILATASANVFLHVPRGSQNRLQENTAENKNHHRLFWANHNSEKVRRGGYNVGEKTTQKSGNEDGHYSMQYFMSGPDLPTRNPETPGNSYLTLEWTQLLGCGADSDGDSIQGCETKIQLMCQDDLADDVQPSSLKDLHTIRNGAKYETIQFEPDGSHLLDPKGECYVDSHDRDLSQRVHRGDFRNKEDAIQFCKDECKKRDYLYAGLQAGAECWCGNDFGKYGKGAATSCNSRCHDKKDQMCGGGWRNQIYLSGLAKENPDQSLEDKNQRKAKSKGESQGIHESWEFYDRCPNYFELSGIKEKRSGLECLHERNHIHVDYATPWRDIVHFSDDVAKCQAEHEAKRQPKYECVEMWNNEDRKHKSDYTNKDDCKANGGQWLEFYEYKQILPNITRKNKCTGENLQWGRPMNWADLGNDVLSAEACLDLGPKAECLPNFDTRHNYLGMADNGNNEVPRYQWALPKYQNNQRCVMRIRQFIYNKDEPQITESNKDLKDQYHQPLYLALAQKFAHNNMVVYEDRSHIFKLLQRPATIDDDQTLHNIVVRGKRGNIVQTYPAVEYDFVPNKLHIKNGDAVQFQWTGSNTHNNGGHSKGQTGDAGEGNGGTDRNNMIQNFYKKTNFPLPYEKQSLFQNATFLWSEKYGEHDANVDLTDDTNANALTSYNAALAHATSGYYWSSQDFEDNKTKLDGRLNRASPSFQGVVFVPGSDAKYYYVGMRNNNFSNRSQKGELIVGTVDEAQYEAELRQKLTRKRPENPCEQYGA